jgi:lambda family phage portal protein
MAGLFDKVSGYFASPAGNSPVRRAEPPPVSRDARPLPSSQFMRGERSPVFFDWLPVLRDQREDVRAAYWRSAARVIDSIQNSGWLAGAVKKSIASTIGTGLRLAAKPDPRCFGGDQDAADQWAHDIERDFEAWARAPLECDASGVSTLAQMCDAALRSDYAYGEHFGLVPWIRRPVSATRTKLQLIPAHRLTQETNGVDLFQGVRVDRDGMPTGYRLRLTQPIVDPGQVIEVARHDLAGRPRAFHVFSGDVGTFRGISAFTPALRVVRQFDQLQDGTLTAALIQAIFAATVQSAAPTQDILTALQSDNEQAASQGIGGSFDDYLGAKTAFYGDSRIDAMGGLARITHLFPGETLDFKRSETPNRTYEPFAKFLLHEIASAIGVSYSTVTGDYSNATYSSVRMETSVLWPVTLWRREHGAAPIYQVAYQCWLEEGIDAGRIQFPGGLEAFIAQRVLASGAEWRGPAMPQADDLKYAKAIQILRDEGLITDEQAFGERGIDWKKAYEQRAREMKYRQKLGLPEPDWAPPGDRPDNKPATSARRPDDGLVAALLREDA